MEEPAKRDPAVRLLFGFALFLIVFFLVAGAIFALSGHAQLLEAALLLAMAFAVVGTVIGLMRGLRSGRAARRPIA